MKLKDFLFASLSKCLIGVEEGFHTKEEFSSENAAKVKEYADYIVNAFWCLADDLMAVVIQKGE